MGDKRFYTIRELEEAVNRTAATLYAFMRSNDEVKQFFKDHRQERSKGGYVYDEKALERLKNQYGVSNGVGRADYEDENAEIPLDSPVPTADDAAKAALEAELNDLKGKYAALQADLEAIKGEKAELLRQNGLKTDEISHLLLLLSQEKAEKQALLPPPRRTIGERIKGLFKKV